MSTDNESMTSIADAFLRGEAPLRHLKPKEAVVQARVEGKTFVSLDLMTAEEELRFHKEFMFPQEHERLQVFRDKKYPSDLTAGRSILRAIQDIIDCGFSPQEVGLLGDESIESFLTSMIRYHAGLKKDKMLDTPCWNNWREFHQFCVSPYNADYLDFDVESCRMPFLEKWMTVAQELKELQHTLKMCGEWNLTPECLRHTAGRTIVLEAYACLKRNRKAKARSLVAVLKADYPELQSEASHLETVIGESRSLHSGEKASKKAGSRHVASTDEEDTRPWY
jgi:hypothetical protein